MEKDKLSEMLAMLDEMAGMMDKIREMIPEDAAEEQSEIIDEATSDEVADAEDASKLKSADDKEVSKAAAVAMLKKSI